MVWFKNHLVSFLVLVRMCQLIFSITSASKMSRAVRILKPAQDEKDLEETTRRLFGSDRLNADELTVLAKEYTAYQRSQPTANFHGLRDYYSLIKGLSGDEELTPDKMM